MSNVRAPQPHKRKAAKDKRQEIILNVLSNTPTSELYDILELLYNGAFKNQLALMEALHEPSGTVHRLLVGMEFLDDGKYSAYPLARLLDADELGDYTAPDGKGSYERASN